LDFTIIPIESIIPLITTIILGLLLIPAFIRLRSPENVVIHLLIYLILVFAQSLTIFLKLLDLPLLSDDLYAIIIGFTQLASILSFGILTLNLLKRPKQVLIRYWVIAIIILIAWGVLALNVMGWRATIAALAGQWMVPTLIVSILGWVVGIGTASIASFSDFRKRQKPAQFLNKLRYWLIADTLLIATGLVLFINPTLFLWVGLPLLTIASVLIGYTVLSYHTPDLSLLLGRTLRYLIITIILFIVLFLSLAATIIATGYYSTSDLLWLSALLAILIANILPPLWNLCNRVFTRIIFGKTQQDQHQIIKRYSRSISSVLEMNRLGDTIINLMIETLAIEKGAVFVNERSGVGNVSLRPLSSLGIAASETTTGHFTGGSPFVEQLRRGEGVISQYDIDTLPQFRAMAKGEKAWLSQLGMELYAPILRQNELIGLLAFGPPSQGGSYYEEDFDLMMALGQQSATAIDSARLFEQLSIINQEVGQLTNQLAGLDQDKSDFLSIASHELRTPLTHIHGYSRMLLDLTEEELQDPAYLKSIMEGVAKGSERMKDVVDMMFDVTEADDGDINLFVGPVDLEEVIDQASRPFLEALTDRRIAFQANVKDLPTVEADGTRLMQAFDNMIGNAIKYTPDGGMVIVEGRATVLDNVGQAVEIVVTDTGIGIDPQYHERIFEKFFRIDDTDHHSTGKTKFKGAGPGLGLTLVKGIAEAHGGKVWVESAGYDENDLPGSKFFFVIPLHSTGRGQAPQSEIKTRHWRNEDLPKADDQKKQ
jgi:signal transduction histidine kinase